MSKPPPDPWMTAGQPPTEVPETTTDSEGECRLLIQDCADILYGLAVDAMAFRDRADGRRTAAGDERVRARKAVAALLSWVLTGTGGSRRRFSGKQADALRRAYLDADRAAVAKALNRFAAFVVDDLLQYGA